MKKSVSDFLENVCSFVRCREVHEDIKEELMLHLEEKAEGMMNEGKDEENAYEIAVASMGSPSEIGESLDKKHRPRTEWSLIFITAVMAFFGAVIVYLSQETDYYAIDTGRYIFYTLIGIAGAATALFYNYMKLKDYPVYLYISAVCILILCYFIGTPFAGVKRYIRLGYITLNVNHISMILFMWAFAGFTVKYKGEGAWGILRLCGIGVFSLLLYLLQPSVSSAMITGIAYLVILITAINKNHFGGRRGIQTLVTLSAVSLAGIVGVLAMLIRSPRAVQRILFVFDKGASDPYNGGWVYSMADKVLKSAKLFGKAEPFSVESIDRLIPGITSDFALINIIHNYGWLAGIFIILVVAVYLIRLFRVSAKTKSSFGCFLSLGCASLLAIQFAVNILYNLGLFPIVDVIMPFVSYGGSGYLASMICVGTVLSVWRRDNILPAIREKEKTIRIRKKYITFEGSRIIIDFDPDEEQEH